MRKLLRYFFLAVAIVAPWLPLEESFARSARQAAPAEPIVVACRAMEVHASREPAVTVVVFHQRDSADREKLGALLRSSSGTSVEYSLSGNAWNRATLFRLKSCFGRGLLIFSGGGEPLKEGGEFSLRFGSQ